jgi:ribonuclease HII
MKLYYKDEYEMGIDEAGRGPLIGRVYAAAVVIGGGVDETEWMKNVYINDSKKMTASQRDKAEKWIIENVKAYAIGYSESFEIDQINILEATCKAMQRAVDGVINVNNTIKRLIIDGCRWEKKFDNEKYEIHSVVKGDATYLSIAMASILAKQAHDRYIIKLCEENPELNEKYDLLNNMGYGTKRHLEGLQKHGTSVFHRLSFKPCK